MMKRFTQCLKYTLLLLLLLLLLVCITLTVWVTESLQIFENPCKFASHGAKNIFFCFLPNYFGKMASPQPVKCSISNFLYYLTQPNALTQRQGKQATIGWPYNFVTLSRQLLRVPNSGNCNQHMTSEIPPSELSLKFRISLLLVISIGKYSKIHQRFAFDHYYFVFLVN